MKAAFFDPLFYISSEKMAFTIRLEVILKEKIEPEFLESAVAQAMKRYPYFALRVIEDGGEYLAASNPEPIVVYEGPEVYPLGSSQVNYHLLAISFEKEKLYFDISHVITDGCGLFPLVKTVLYYYFCNRYGVKLDPSGFRLADSPFFPDETGNPYPEELMQTAEPFYTKKIGRYFRLCDGPYVNDEKATVYRCRVRQDEFMRFNHDNDGSPCVLISVLMAKAIWALHPEIKEDLVSAISYNFRPGINNKCNYRMLCKAIFLDYQNDMRDYDISRLCTFSRGKVMLQSQPENALYYAQQRKERFEALAKFPSLAEKKEIVGKRALADSVDNTFSVSYVGRQDFGSIEQYIEAVHPTTDGSVYKSLFVEVFSLNGWFDITFLQGFSSDVYYRAFLRQLKANGLNYREKECTPLRVPKMTLEQTDF